MKKILSSLIAVTAVAGFASAVSAAPSDTSVLSGSVTGTCSITAVNGTLPTGALTQSLTTAPGGEGSFDTVCNTATATLSVVVDAAIAGDDPAAGQTLTREFSLTTGTGAYDATTGTTTLPSGFVAVFNPTTAIHNGFSSTASTMKVLGKVYTSGPSATQNLAAGPYKVRVKATVTP
jgi:hypothetical protein